MSEATRHHRACHLCEAICGLTIETRDEQILSIKGDPEDGFSRGHICPKAVALQDIQNDPDRLRHPMRRVGSEWQAIEWDEAFALVAERLADRVVVTDDNPRNEDPLQILSEIRAGFTHPERAAFIPGRAEAIANCIGGSELDDVVLLAGKIIRPGKLG